MIDDKALLSEYLSESEELLESLLADLDSLGAQPDHDPDINLINRIFRTVHSLKGLSGMMGLVEVQSLAHEFEDILEELRLGQISLDRDNTAIFQEVGSGLAALVGGAARGSAAYEDYDRFRELLASVAGKSRARARGSENEIDSLGLSAQERDQLREDEKYRISVNLKAGRLFYLVSVQFDLESLTTKYNGLASKLESSGERITTFSEKTKEPALIGFRLLFATPLKESEVKKLVEPFGGRVSRIGRSPWRRAGEALKVVGRKQRAKQSSEKRGAEAKASTVLPTSFAQESLHPVSSSVRVELSQVDELSGLAHELAIETQHLSSMADRFLIAAGFGARERFDLRLSARRLEREFLELEERLVELRMVSMAQTFTRAARLAGRLARDLGKSISVEVSGRETQLDKMIVDRIADPIYHILRNAIDHGVEPPDVRKKARKNPRGKIRIEASLEGSRVVIAVCDDGRGINPSEVYDRAVSIGAAPVDEELKDEDVLRLIFRPGFSTLDRISEVSGRGVGLDAVERAIHELGGEVRVSSELGKGSRFEMAVPSTLVMISAFIVRVGDLRYAINVGQIKELLYAGREEIMGRDGKRNIEYRDSKIPLIELRYLLGLGGARVFDPTDEAAARATGPLSPSPVGRQREPAGLAGSAANRVPVLITRSGERHVAIAVEQFDEQREIIVKSLGSLGPRFKGVVGAVDLEGGDVALVLDLPSLLLIRSLRM
ncbi:MAG TPA: ATP-binding protein [Blastocatellia bacterium]|jgi:two-component system chemotaxis sensor kinase CheA|nr:ATP-binding protein [Blastocatellia bacterium]